MAKQVCKVARFELKCLMDAGNHMRYPYHELPTLQQAVSQAKNRTVQACWEWYNIEVAFQIHRAQSLTARHILHVAGGVHQQPFEGRVFPMYSQTFRVRCVVQ